MLPWYPSGDTKGNYEYNIPSAWRKLVADYTGLSLEAVGRLDYLRYLALRRDAYIYRLEQSEAGREYLANAWRLTQTKPDRAALREQFGSKEVFAVRSGLVNKHRLFSENESAYLCRCVDFTKGNCETLTYEQERQLDKLQEKLTDAYPSLEAEPPTFEQKSAPQQNM